MAFYSIHREKMVRMLLVYGLPKETVNAIMMLYKNMRVIGHSPDEDIDFFDIVAGILLRDTLAPFLFISYIDYLLWILKDLMKENCLTQQGEKEANDILQKNIHADYTDNLALLSNIFI